MGIIITRKGQNFLLVAIFLSFLVLGLSATKWDNSIEKDWKEIDIGFSSLLDKSQIPYIRDLGDINDDLYNEILMFDSFEKNIIMNKSAEYLNATKYPNEDSFINEAVDLLKNKSYFDYYGKSSIGAYTLDQNNPNDFIWKINYQEQDILKCEIVQDINEDNVNDVILSTGAVKNLPNLLFFTEEDYYSLFENYNWLFSNFFEIDIENDTILVTPIYEEYKIILLSGKDGDTLNSSDLIVNLGFDRYIVDIAVLNNTIHNPNKPDVIILSNSLNPARFYSPMFYRSQASNKSQINFTDPTEYINSVENVSAFNYEWMFTGLKLDPLEIIWQKSLPSTTPIELLPEGLKYLVDLNHTGLLHFSEDFPAGVQFNVTINEANFIDIEPCGENFIVRFSSDIAHYETGGSVYDFPFYTDNCTDRLLFGLYSGETGGYLWKGNSSIDYLSKNIDFTGNGFGQINGYYVSDTDINFILYDPADGNAISKSKLVYNPEYLLTYDNLQNTKIILSDDDAMENDNVLEIISISINSSHYSDNDHLNISDEIQFVRINMNVSSQLSMITTINSDFHINLWDLSSFEIFSTNVDFNDDNTYDYIFSTCNTSVERKILNSEQYNSNISETAIFSGMGNKLIKREIESAFSFYIEEYIGIGALDFRKFQERVCFFHDPNDNRMISIVSAEINEFIFIQDLNNYKTKVSFMDFFIGADILIYMLGIGGILCLLGFFLGFRKQKYERDYNDTAVSEIKSISIKMWLGILLMFGLIAGITYFFVISIDLTIGYTSIAISPEGQLIWFILLYPAIFGMLALLPELYNSTASYLSEKIFLKPQKRMYEFIYTRRKKKDYRIVIIDMAEKYRMSTFSRISRMLLPILISFTIGTFIYQGLGPDGFIYQNLSPILIDRPLTNPTNLGIITPQMVNANDLWIEIGKFARYCIMPMIITYLFTTIIIPGAWLLDDVGVCFYEKALKTRAVSDIDSVSKFFLNAISGFFGFTAIISFVQLFIPMLTNINDLISNLVVLSNEDPIFSVLVLIGALIIFPIFAGILLMLSAQQKMEVNYEENSQKLQKRLIKNKIDVTPLELSAVLNAKVELTAISNVEQKKISTIGDDKTIYKKKS